MSQLLRSIIRLRCSLSVIQPWMVLAISRSLGAFVSSLSSGRESGLAPTLPRFTILITDFMPFTPLRREPKLLGNYDAPKHC